MKSASLLVAIFLIASVVHAPIAAEIESTIEKPAESETQLPDVPVSDQPFSSWLQGREPDRIYRVIPSETPSELRYAPEYIGNFEVIGAGPSNITADNSKILTSLLKNNSSFGALRKDRCRFRPGISLASGTGKNRIDLLVCFACDEIGIVDENGALRAVYAFDQPARDILLGLAKSTLPNDEAIQELPAVRRDRPAPPPFAQPE